MKKIFFTLVILLTSIAAEAKVINITLADGTRKVFTSSELSAIDFNDDGTLTITTYDGRQLPAPDAAYEELEIGDEAVITEIIDDTLRTSTKDMGLDFDIPFERPVKKVNYVYPSTDPFGESITLSGTMFIPDEIWNGCRRSEGILLYNHYTLFASWESPTLDDGPLEAMFMANPLNPDYIMVESDFYGFGATMRFFQAYMQGVHNGRASLDGLLAARQLLKEQGIDYGPLCFNIGYSSAGYDALATQKLRDMEYADLISFDKTFSGGGPNDVRECYRQYVIADSTAYNAVPLLLMVSTNETQKLGLSYDDVFQPYISEKIDEWIMSKKYWSWPVCDSIGREKKIHEILTAPYCDLGSEQSRSVQDLFRSFSMNYDDWTPDPSQRIFLFHSRGDDYVPLASARPMIPFLKRNGFEPSIIPGKTNLQTNFVIRDMGHLSATVVFYVQTLAAIKAWPQMYIDGELNPIYQNLISQDATPVDIMRQLDVMGIDCRTLIFKAAEYISNQGESGEGQPADIQTVINAVLAQTGITQQELLEMEEDSGIDIQAFLIKLLAYLCETPQDNEVQENEENAAPNKLMALRLNSLAVMHSATPLDDNVKQLRHWLKMDVPGWQQSIKLHP